MHLYLTVPFVLSWSLLEAMAAGCCIVASATEPVQEVVKHGESGWLVPLMDVQAQAEAMDRLLDDPERRLALGGGAQRKASQYNACAGTEAWSALMCEDTDQTA